MNINKYYEETGLNDIGLSKLTGVPQSTLWRIRTGKVIPRSATAIRIEKGTNAMVKAVELLLPEEAQGQVS